MAGILPTIQSRYQFLHYNQLCTRVASVIDEKDVLGIEALMLQRKFLPAGNTLLAGVRPIRPNCSVLPILNEHNYDETSSRAELLWTSHIGTGFRFDGMQNPGAALRDLSARNAKISLDFRCQRGSIGIIDIEHPCTQDFIDAKGLDIYNFNISVAITNAFMNRVFAGDSKAIELLRMCATRAHATGDPGIVFIDRIQPTKPTPFGRIDTLVPCGEQGMFADETCNLGAMNVSAFDWNKPEQFACAVRRCIHVLDNVVDLLDIPDKRMLNRTRELRRIGLGIMGFATLLKQQNIPYNSEQSYSLARFIGSLLKNTAIAATREMAQTRGGLWFDNSRRNITTTCFAPTGGIALLAGPVSFAFEPFFNEATVISATNHLKMLSVWQDAAENLASKTINLHESCSIADVYNIFIEAFNQGIKTFTIYRNKCRDTQPLSCSIGTGTC